MAIPNALPATATTAAHRRLAQREHSEQQQQHFAKAIMACLLRLKFSVAIVPPVKQCTLAAEQYWHAVYVQWHERQDRIGLELQLLCARLWWRGDVMQQTLLIKQYLRASVCTRHHKQSFPRYNTQLRVAIPSSDLLASYAARFSNVQQPQRYSGDQQCAMTAAQQQCQQQCDREQNCDQAKMFTVVLPTTHCYTSKKHHSCHTILRQEVQSIEVRTYAAATCCISSSAACFRSSAQSATTVTAATQSQSSTSSSSISDTIAHALFAAATS
eukprot:16610-Heterococcus_DN1.PRE.3